MLGGSVIDIVFSSLIDYFGPSSTIFDDFDWQTQWEKLKFPFLADHFHHADQNLKKNMIFFENLITGAKKEAESYVYFYAFIPWKISFSYDK